MASSLQLILGGARSGKSGFALAQEDENSFRSLHFLATATPGDAEMKARIERHRSGRDARWKTREEPYGIVQALASLGTEEGDLTVLDCATLWISNLLCGIGGKALTPPEAEDEFRGLIRGLGRHKGSLRVVSNEVGLGIVPGAEMARQFQDLQGELNKSLAAVATQVIFMTAGLPRKIK